ncbi:phage-related protein-like [Roseobacter sp. MED193]|uniref:hypothetical protein n=1 Tax=Roseobacter sp. MED193 TaxID=314262 RepID=UPI000068C23F|nr:hypothetical protein [Roseobacter sp. MED193]EAQ46591.1 phage-related protein-like [Roseobacter sp. MED193]
MATEATQTFSKQDAISQIPVTILEALGGKRLTKRFHPKGCEQYSRAKWFRPHTCKVSSFLDLAELLGELEADVSKVIVMGSVRPEFRESDKILRRSRSRENAPATLEDMGSHLVHFDVDNIEKPAHLCWDDPQTLAKWTWDNVTNQLPALKSASVFWQASSSAATKGKEYLAKFHFWCLADRPLTTTERKYLFATVGSDKSAAGIAQPNYTAAPVFDGVEDPLAGRSRSGCFLGAREFIDTASIGFPSLSLPRPAKKKKAHPPSSGTKQKLSPPISSSCATTTDKGRQILQDVCERIRSGKMGNTAIFNQSQRVGGYVTGSKINLDEARSELLAAAAATGHNRYEEAVDNGLRVGIDRPLILGEKPKALEPFHPAPTENRQVAIKKHSDTIRTWFKNSTHFLNVQKSCPKTGPDLLPPRAFLSGAMGVGKTSVLVGRNGQSGLLHEAHGLVSAMFLPQHEKAGEAFTDYTTNAPAGAPPAVVVRGRNQPDPYAVTSDTRMCLAYKVAHKLNEHGVSVRTNLCPRCPLRTQCGYLRQEAEIESHLKGGRGLVMFAPHDFAFIDLPGEAKPDLVVFDERPRDFAVENVHVTLSQLVDDIIPDISPHVRSEDAKTVLIGEALFEQQAAIQPIKHALLKSAGQSAGVSLNALREQGITKVLLQQAIDDLRQFGPLGAVREVHSVLQTDGREATLNDLNLLGTRLLRLPTKTIQQLQILFECMMEEIDGPNEFATSVTKARNDKRDPNQQPGFQAVRIRPLKHGADQPFLYLDGTADADVSRAVFGTNLACHHHPVERNAHVTQVVGCNFSKRRVLGIQNNGEPLFGKIATESKNLFRDLQNVLERHPEAALFSNKPIIKELASAGSHKAGHFGALRGRNYWEDKDTVIVIGREQPSPQSVEGIARAYAAASGAGFTSGDYKKVPRGIRTSGDTVSIDVFAHPDLWGDRILRQIREAEIEQAIDRIRLIHNSEPKAVYLLSPVVVNATVDKVVGWQDFKQGGTRTERAIEKYGVLFLSPRDCARYMPDIWTNPQTASADLNRAKLVSDLPYRSNLYGVSDGKGPSLVQFWPKVGKGQRSRKKSALAFGRADQLKCLIEALTGPLTDFRSG